MLYQWIYLRIETQLVSITLILKHPGNFSIQGCMYGLSRAIWRKTVTFLLCYTAILLCKLVFKLLPTHYSFGCQYQMCLCQLCFSLLFLRGIWLHFLQWDLRTKQIHVTNITQWKSQIIKRTKKKLLKCIFIAKIYPE